jgi:hypothetical protein
MRRSTVFVLLDASGRYLASFHSWRAARDSVKATYDALYHGEQLHGNTKSPIRLTESRMLHGDSTTLTVEWVDGVAEYRIIECLPQLTALDLQLNTPQTLQTLQT